VKNRIVNATHFKANCLALLDEVQNLGGTITVTKRGRPVATVVPARRKPWKSTKGSLEGKVKIVGDIVNFSTADLWDVVREAKQSG
jgi:prevent-host-death family protein